MAFWKHKKTGGIKEAAGASRNWFQISSTRAREIREEAKTTEALKRAKALYAPGGGFGKGVESAIERGRIKTEASGMQGLVSAGLAGTTMAGTLGKKYQEEVAMPARLSIEEERTQALAGIEMTQAGMGFQAGQAGLQRGFQAGESAAGRDLQRYIADMQARLQRGSMAPRSRPTARPVQQAQQFPSLYGTGRGPAAPSQPSDFDFGETSWPGSSRLPEVTSEELNQAFPLGGPVRPSIDPSARYYA